MGVFFPAGLGAQGQDPFDRLGRRGDHGGAHLDTAGGQVGEHLKVLDPDRRRVGAQFHPSHRAVPVRLRVVGDAVGVLTDINAYGVVHPQRQAVLAWLEGVEREFVGGGQAVARPRQTSVHPEAGFPVGPFEKKREAPFAIGPFGGNLDLAFIPGRADVIFHRRQPEGHLEVGRIAVGRVGRVGEEGTVLYPAGPLGTHGRRVAQSVLGQRPGQMGRDGRFEGFGPPPQFFAFPFRVEPTTPVPGQ